MHVANSQHLKIVGARKMSVYVQLGNCEVKLELGRVLAVPGLCRPLLVVKSLMNKDVSVKFQKNAVKLKKDKRVVNGYMNGKLFILRTAVRRKVLALITDIVMLWHCKSAHASISKMKQVKRKYPEPASLKLPKQITCLRCAEAKSQMLLFPPMGR
jgi:hypothetical protein